jgi:heme/copper-type cytochrome/quinol oxidase subunit 2
MMRSNVVVADQKGFDGWLGQQSSYAQLLARAETGGAKLALADPLPTGGQ